MHRRMEGWDYSQPRIYMITIATEGRRPLLGLLRGDPSAAPGSVDGPRVEYSEVGRWVNNEVERIPIRYPQIRVLGKQVMPDHLHFLLHVTRALPCHLGKVIASFKAGCNKGYRAITGAATGAATTAQQSCTAPDTPLGCKTGGEVAAEKKLAGRQRGVGCAAVVPQRDSRKHGLLWETGYHDRVLSGHDQLQTLIDYIHDNPRRLLVKRQHSALFRVREIEVGGQRLQAVGNFALLRAPQRIAVRLSRRLTSAEIEAEVARLLQAAREGAVLVSPFISPGERAVRDAALAAALPMIRLLDNGFPPIYKPSGVAFEACANGRLLLLSPFPYHTQRMTVTRDQCHQLNLLACMIAGGRYQ